jgi:hypothetical protein
MKFLKYFLPILFIVTIIGCGKKNEPIVFIYKEYKDPLHHYHLAYPNGWVLSPTDASLKIVSSQEAMNTFFNPSAPSELGALFTVDVRKPALVSDLQILLDSVQASDKEIIAKYDKVEDSQLGGVPAKKINYTLQLSDKFQLIGEKYIALIDSAEYVVEYRSFNEISANYKPAFDTLVKSFVVMKPEQAKNEETKPSQDFVRYDYASFGISYPDNFDNTFPAKKGDIQYSVEFKGYRQDCSARIDIFPAKGLSLEKVFEQNKAKYAGVRSTNQTTLGGQKAMYLTYSPMAKVVSRAYFTVKGDKVFRITTNWNTEVATDYQPAIEKMVGSFTMK